MGQSMDKKALILKISPEEAKTVLVKLYENNPSFRDAIVLEIENLLSDINIEDIAYGVYYDLDGIDVEELWDRSGSSRYGYNSPEDMAFTMVEEAIELYSDQIEKLQELKKHDQAKSFCMGVLKGIYKYDKESKSEFKDWASDVPGECFQSVFDDWKKKHKRKKDIKIMIDYLQANCPDWSNWIR